MNARRTSRDSFSTVIGPWNETTFFDYSSLPKLRDGDRLSAIETRTLCRKEKRKRRGTRNSKSFEGWASHHREKADPSSRPQRQQFGMTGWRSFSAKRRSPEVEIRHEQGQGARLPPSPRLGRTAKRRRRPLRNKTRRQMKKATVAPTALSAFRMFAPGAAALGQIVASACRRDRRLTALACAV